jgi:hypothetical protein
MPPNILKFFCRNSFIFFEIFVEGFFLAFLILARRRLSVAVEVALSFVVSRWLFVDLIVEFW